ncbi:MAG: hypothetical protein KJ645_14650, partial [Planctomycetes bacterium]|nr:hypothetical protein [Planctomycetota bacterium]
EVEKILVVWRSILEDGSLDPGWGIRSELDPYGCFRSELAPGRHRLTLENQDRERLCEGPEIDIVEAERKSVNFAMPR